MEAVTDPRDIVDIACLAQASAAGAPATDGQATGERKWLGVWFRCCHVYGRMYLLPGGERYAGTCPRCGSQIGAKVGDGGTTRRFFEAT